MRVTLTEPKVGRMSHPASYLGGKNAREGTEGMGIEYGVVSGEYLLVYGPVGLHNSPGLQRALRKKMLGDAMLYLIPL